MIDYFCPEAKSSIKYSKKKNAFFWKGENYKDVFLPALTQHGEINVGKF
jgi:hypothetical protein